MLAEIITALKGQRLGIAARRVFAKSRIALAVSLERQLMAALSSREELVKHMQAAAAGELAKATSALSEDQVEGLLDIELRTIDAVIESPSAEAALRLVPAKQLLNTLAPRAGCKNGSDLMRSLRRHFKPQDFPLTKALAEALQKSLA